MTGMGRKQSFAAPWGWPQPRLNAGGDRRERVAAFYTIGWRRSVRTGGGDL
jgi:hypothetical protein